MGNSFFEKVSYISNNNYVVKKLVRKPIKLIRYIRSYSQAKKLYERIIKNISSVKNDNIIWYFCSAEHSNLGDLAQRYCIEQWLSENYSDATVVEIPTKGILRFKKKIIKAIQDKYDKDQLIVFQSGYTMSDLHPDEKVRNIILNKFNEGRILIFPQTILYRDEKKKEETFQLLKKCSGLLLLVRDEQSYQYACKNFPGIKTELYPDIVTTLIGKRDLDNDRQGIGLCVRNDGEKYYSYEQINDLNRKLGNLDTVTVTDTDCKDIGKITSQSIEKSVWNKIQSFSEKRLIVTDRYHGTIFSLVAGTPVIVIKTKDHKVSTGVKWFEGIYDGYIYYCDEIDKVPELAKKILADKKDHVCLPYFKKKYYDTLKNKI